MPVSDPKPKNSVRQYVFDIGKIIEGALGGDQTRVLTYADRLRGRLAEDGEVQAARRLEQLMRRTPGHVAQVADIAISPRSVPVDGESRLPIADLDPAPAGADKIVLEPEVASLVERFIASVEMADRLAAAGLSASSSMLMHGPPGVGKTLLARAIAERLKLPLITARTDALVSSFLGNTAKNVRMLFDHASARPCVLFLDEFDAIGKMRDDSRELGELKRVVISILQNIDALGPDHVLLAATNHEHLLDPAIWRRFTYRVRLDLPSPASRAELFRRYLRDRLTEQEIELLAALSDGATGASIKQACDECLRAMILSGQEDLSLDRTVSVVMRALGNATESCGTEDLVRQLARRLGRKVSQEQIGRIVGLSQSRVSRILNQKGSDRGRRPAASD